ncbi:MAG: hypothetical protein RPR28_06400 [Cycloclasticus sp.]
MKPEKMQLRLDTDSNRRRAAAWSMQLGKKTDVPVLVTFAPDMDGRSLRQNRLWWVWMGLIGDFTGDGKRGADLHYRHEYLAPEIITARGQRHEVIPSTKDLSVGDMHDLMRNVLIDATQFLEILLPGPETQGLSEVFNDMEKAPKCH